MDKAIARRAIGTLLLLAAVTVPRAGRSSPEEWPTWRHDPGRSGRTELRGRFEQPSPVWSVPTGGSLQPTGFITANVDGLRGDEWLAVQGGRVRAFDTSGRVLWATRWLGVEQIVAARDLDGDGTVEIVATRASATASLVVLRGADGGTVWAGPTLAPGTKALRPDTVRIADLDGDGRQELVVKAWPDAHVRAYRRTLGGDFEPLWETSYVGNANYNPPVVADWDGDGAPEVLIPVQQDLLVLSGGTGETEQRLVGVLPGHAYSHLESVAAPDGRGALLLVIGREPYTRSVTLLDLRPGAGGGAPPGVVWQLDWQPPEASELLCPVKALGDLDGDGTPEVLLAVFDDRDAELDAAGTPGDHDGVAAPGVWSLLALDLVTGHAKAHLPGWIPEAATDFDGDGHAEVLARRAAGDRTGPPTLGGLRLLTFTDGALETAWELPGAELLRTREERPAGRHDRDLGRPLVGVPGPDGLPTGVLVLRDADEDGWADRLERYTRTAEGMQLDATLELADHGTLAGLGFDESSPQTDPQGALYVVRSTGALQRLDSDLQPTLERPVGGFGTHIALARPTQDAPNALFYCTSDGRLVSATMDMAAAPPTLTERWTLSTGDCEPISVVATPGGGAPAVVTAGRGANGGLILVAADADTGATRWVHPLEGWQKASVAVPATVEGALDRLIVRGVSDRHPTDTDLRLRAVSLQTGDALWEEPATENTWGIDPLLVADLDGDGTDTILHMDGHVVELLSASDGGHLSERPCDWCKSPLLADFDGDGVPDLLANQRAELCVWRGPALDSGWCVPKRYVAEGTVTAAGVARTSDDAELLLLLPTSEGLLRTWSGTEGLPGWEQTLRAGGTAAGPAGPDTRTAELGAPTTAGLHDSARDIVLTSTEDGWLYGLDSVDGSLRWSLDLGASVADLAVGDLDADGEPDMVVSTADGRLTWLGQPTLQAPGRLREVELDEAGEPLADGEDIDVSERVDSLAAAWNPVPAATGYRLALVDGNGQPVVDWVDVPAVQSWLFSGLRLLPGASYRVRALARGPGGSSPMAESDGVRIVDLAPPEILSFTAAPERFDPATGTTTLTALARDRSGVAFWSVQISDDDGAVWRRESLTEGQKLELELVWPGRDAQDEPLPAGPYRAELRVTDWSGHMATAALTLTLAPAEVPPDPDAGVDPPDGGPGADATVDEPDAGEADAEPPPDAGPTGDPADAGTTPDATAGAPCAPCADDDCGCSCAATPGTVPMRTASVLLVLVAALGLIAVRRR